MLHFFSLDFWSFVQFVVVITYSQPCVNLQGTADRLPPHRVPCPAQARGRDGRTRSPSDVKPSTMLLRFNAVGWGSPPGLHFHRTLLAHHNHHTHHRRRHSSRVAHVPVLSRSLSTVPQTTARMVNVKTPAATNTKTSTAAGGTAMLFVGQVS